MLEQSDAEILNWAGDFFQNNSYNTVSERFKDMARRPSVNKLRDLIMDLSRDVSEHGPCWCQPSISPLHGHSPKCEALRKFLKEA